MSAFGAALKPRGARRFFLAHAQSSLGSGIAIVGLPLLAYDHYRTPWALTAVLLCELLPAVALGPLLGTLADRLPRRTSLVVADVLRLGAFGALALVPSLALMIVCALVAGIGTALFNPSALASVSQIASPQPPPGGDEPLLRARRPRPDARAGARGCAAAGHGPAHPDGDQRRHLHDLRRAARHDPAQRAGAALGRLAVRLDARGHARDRRAPRRAAPARLLHRRRRRGRAWSTSARCCSRASCWASAAPGSPR